MSLAGFYNTEDVKGFRAPTHIISGSGSRVHAGAACASFSSILIVVDRFFAQSPLVEEIAASLSCPVDRKIIVQGEPEESFVLQNLAAIGEFRTPSAILAIGGGSTIDTAKALAAGISWNDLRRKDRAEPALPIIAMPTTAGTGSETSRYYVVSDAASGEKRSCRSWSLCPAVAILDPVFLDTAPQRLLLLSAFDAFCHLWECLVCRHEHESTVSLLATNGMADILHTLASLPARPPWPTGHILALQRASAWGGIALSNVRTGIVHKLGEGIAGATGLSHAETLLPFFGPAVAQYADAIRPRLKDLFVVLSRRSPAISSIPTLTRFWLSLFESAGILQDIQNTLAGRKLSVEKLTEYVARDTVLYKEHPALLSTEIIREIAGHGLTAKEI